MIIDTTFVIDLLRNNPQAIKKAYEIEENNLPILLTTITIFELWQGIETNSKEKEEKIKNFLERVSILTLDLEGAKIAGTIYKELEIKGQRIDAEDSMIAGIVLSRNETLLTRNIKHFERIKGLKAETY